MSDGTHRGTAESESIKRFPGKLLFAVKKAAGMPTAAAVSVEKKAMARVRSAVCAISFYKKRRKSGGEGNDESADY